MIPGSFISMNHWMHFCYLENRNNNSQQHRYLIVITALLYHNAHKNNKSYTNTSSTCYGDNEAINILPRAVADAGSFDANVGNELISR